MTKRILAIVMAMVMCLSVLAVEVFANGTASWTITADYSGTSITVSWGAVSGATKYDVEILKGNSKVNGATGVTGTSTTLNVYSAGTYVINVYAKNANGGSIGSSSTTCTIPQQSTQSGITVSSTSGGVTVSWTSTATGSAYVSYTYLNDKNVQTSGGQTVDSGAKSCTLSVVYDKLISVSVMVNGSTIGTWNKSYNPGSSTTTGNVTYSSGYLRWNGGYNTTYSIGVTVNGSYAGSLNPGNYNYYDVSNIIKMYSNSTIVFTVYAGNSSIGTYTYYPQQQSYNGVYIYGTTVSWQGSGYQTYSVVATANGRTLMSQSVGYNTSVDLANYIDSSYLRSSNISITVYAGNSILGTATYYYNGYNQQGNVYVSGTYVSWQGNGYQTYSVVATANGRTLMSQSVGYNTSVNLANYIDSSYLRNSNIDITVYAGNNILGTATYYCNNTGVGTNGLKVEAANGRATISWNAVSGATTYKVIYSIGGSQYQREFPQNYVTLDYTRGLSVTVQYKYGNGYNTIGSASVSASGVVTNNSTPVVNNPSYIGNTVNGINCTLTIGTTTSTLTWQSYPGAVRYDILYTNTATNTTNMVSSSTTSVSIPYGSSNSKGFTCQVVAYGTNSILTGGPFATVTYSGGIVNPSTTDKSEIKNLVLTETGNGTTVTWEPISGAITYQVDYSRTDISISSTNNTTTTTSYVLPFNRSVGFEVYVYAYVGNRLQTVGSAVHVAGDSYTTTTTTKPADNEPTLSAYVTNFKGVATDKKVVLSWNAASGNPTYDVYWKRSTSSEWKLAKSTTKRALTISGLNTGVSYDFKVVANGKDSGIVTVTTPKTGSTTVTAKDPSGAGTVTATVPEILSVQSKNGTLEVSWCKVKNATTYKVYIADQNSSNPSRYTAVPSTTYWPGVKIDLSGTTAKITGMKAGTYKIRIKASTDNGKTWTNLADCDYRTVTVS